MRSASWLGVIGLILLLPQILQAEDDAHDKLVYERYRREIQPSAINSHSDMKHAELDRPATKADVESGRAIFSLEGLGEVRVWRLPDRCPVTGCWWTTSSAPRTEAGHAAATNEPKAERRIGADGRRELLGYVCQAEELKVEGTWKRYYGFLCQEGAAVVPAEDIELFNSYASPVIDYEIMQSLGMEWGIMVPGPGRLSLKTQDELGPKLSDPLPVSLHFENLNHNRQEVPATWYTNTPDGPALREGLTISLFWAGFEPKRPDAGTASDKDFTAVESIRNAHFTPDRVNRVIEFAESFQALALDLHDWFKIEREGYYKVCFELDGNAPGLTKKFYGNLDAFFTIGKPPQQPTIAEFNAQIPPLGGTTDEERLKRVIKESIKPKSVEHKPLPADVEALLAWSKPVNGLAARIEFVWAKRTFFLRLKNVSDEPLSVPTGNPADEKAAPLFELYVQQGSSPWRRVAETGDYGRYFSAPFDPAAQVQDANRSRLPKRQIPERQPTDWPWVALRPGEDCVALVVGSDEDDTGEAKVVKGVMRQPDASIAGRWSGVLETPRRAMELSYEQERILRAALPFPSHFPPLSYDYSGVINQCPIASAVERLHGPNRPLIDMLAVYEPAGVCKEFEQRMRAEKIAPMKLLLASAAAAAGSEEAAMLFLEMMKETDYRTVINLHNTLWITRWNYSGGPPAWQKRELPEWLVDLYLAILSDNRFVTGLENTNWQKGTSFTISSCETANLVFALGDGKCGKVVPLLIERVKRRQADWYTLNALGEIGDARAVSVLIESVKGGYFDEQQFELAVYALGKLKARDAVPVLLDDIEYPISIETLGEIGDPRAVPALREIVAAKGGIVRKGKPVTPEHDGERLYAAKVALAHLDGENEVLHLAAMLADPTLERNHRYDVVMRLGMRPDPRAIPHLVRVIKTDSDHYIIDMAIQALSEFKYKAAVEGLIDCFDVTFKEENLGKGEHVTAATYRNLLARSLQRITGQPFGADKEQWLTWWHEKGERSSELK
jgi:HEAT repeat protein